MLENRKSFNASEIEEHVLSLWKEKDIFKRSLSSRKKGKEFSFWEGPPYANGRPGIHHVVARVIKDVFLRYKTMRGYYVPRKGGWDTHGLPIEIETEKKMGIGTKKEIERLGIDVFNEMARESIFRYKDEWEKLTQRIGYWLDLDDAYVTYAPEYIESLWWVFSRIAQRGHLKESYKVVPYCFRCQTALANHELAQPGVYQNASDPSVYILFPLKKKKNEYLLVWTTTPWTLSANVAIALDGESVYKQFSVGGKKIWAHHLPDEYEDAKVLRKQKGKDMIGWEYEAAVPYKGEVSLPRELHQICEADFVSMDEGTGLVHIAPTFGEDDFSLIFPDGVGEDHVLPQTISDDGVVSDGCVGEGKMVKEADSDIMTYLKEKDLVFKEERKDHEYPFCWRCSSPLLYWARRAWFFEVSSLRDELVKANKNVTWVPSHIKEGRFGEWIAQAKDWAISRERFWGTPLPIWKSSSGDMRVIGSLDDLNTHRAFSNTLSLVRHGEADANVEGWWASGKETKEFTSHLTEKGKTDMKKLALKLKKEHVDLIITSPYKRTKESAAILSKELGIEVIEDDRLREREAGVFAHKDISQFYEFMSKEGTDPIKGAPEGGESLYDIALRATSLYKDLYKKHRDKHIVILSHGDVLRVFQAVCGHISLEEMIKKEKSFLIKTGGRVKLSLDNLPVNQVGEIDLHRPYVDDVILRSDKGEDMKRISSVADVWFDSGAMPYGSTHFPFKHKGKKPEGFPADFISEGIDQTRGWFYTLLATSTLLGMGTPYKNVVSLGLVLDKHGQKMSKSKGNIVDPWSLVEKYGVDAIRWYFYTLNNPGEPKLFDDIEVGKTLRRFLLVTYNSFSFLELYGKKKISLSSPFSSEHVLDIWILTRLQETIKQAQSSMDEYDVTHGAGALEHFVDDLSRWYIRRSRRRLQKPETKKEWEVASGILAYTLLMFSKIAAPFIPFFSDALYQSLRSLYSFKGKDSVHLEEWPLHTALGKKEKKLLEDMQWVRDVASSVLSQRAEAQIKVRQPLRKIICRGKRLSGEYADQLLNLLKDEINVKEITFSSSQEEECVVDTIITDDLKEEGELRELIRFIQGLRQEAGYDFHDEIALFVEGEEKQISFIKKYETSLKKEAHIKECHYTIPSSVDLKKTYTLEGSSISVGVSQ